MTPSSTLTNRKKQWNDSLLLTHLSKANRPFYLLVSQVGFPFLVMATQKVITLYFQVPQGKVELNHGFADCLIHRDNPPPMARQAQQRLFELAGTMETRMASWRRRKGRDELAHLGMSFFRVPRQRVGFLFGFSCKPTPKRVPNKTYTFS